MIQAIIALFITLIKNVAVIIVMAYVFSRTSTYQAIINDRLTLKHRIGLSVVFGIFAIYGTLSGIPVLGAIANIRDLGPAIAGLIAGPWVGLSAGLIGAVHRYALGGLTANSCSLSTILAGLFGGLIYLANRKKFVGVLPATVFMVAMEALHMGLALLISRPFDQVLALVKQIALPMITTNGLGMAVFSFMLVNLIHEKQTESIKEAIEGELKIAREIQMGIVPKIFPPYPEREEFAIHALLEPAKEVGGDFFDFFLLDQDTLCFTIGDVSGKGVPASLFMAVTKTLIKAKAFPGWTPDTILAAVNNDLCRDNDSGMFVTVFLAIFTISSGRVLYSNGGHNLPYVIRREGQILPLAKTPGIALGAMEDAPFGCAELLLGPGDTLVLYTDGVVEAMDPAGQLYGGARLEKCLAAHAAGSVESLNREILNSVRLYAGAAPQSDDITVLTLRNKQADLGVKLTLKNDLAELARLAEAVEAFGARHQIPAATVSALNLSLDELVTNIISYGYPDAGEHEIAVTMRLLPDEIEVTVRDDGRAFNPLETPEPDLTSGIEDRPVGGLGIHLVRQMTDSQEYRRQGTENVLTLRKSIRPAVSGG